MGDRSLKSTSQGVRMDSASEVAACKSAIPSEHTSGTKPRMITKQWRLEGLHQNPYTSRVPQRFVELLERVTYTKNHLVEVLERVRLLELLLVDRIPTSAHATSGALARRAHALRAGALLLGHRC